MPSENSRPGLSKRTFSAFPPPLSKPTRQQDPYSSPPRTPPQNGKHRAPQRANLEVRPSQRETFLDDITPVEYEHGNDSMDDERDPHDLALSPKHVTRASVVDNMLLSLDQFSGDPMPFEDSRFYGSSQDADAYAAYLRYSSMQIGRPRGHTFSSSLSSDVEIHSEENSGRYSSQSNRGRRSNSSSNYHPGLQRIDSIRGVAEGITTRSKVYAAQRAAAPVERTLAHRPSRVGINGSRSSGSSSVDFNQMLSGTRVGNYRERRSASFDYGSNTLSDAGQRDHIRRYDDIDAAPTPTVPAGPRRNRTPPMPDNTVPALAAGNTRTPALSRKNSAKSARSMYNRKGRSDTLGTATIRGRGDEYKHQEDIPDMPPLPNYSEPAPSPTIAFHKTSYFSNPPPPQEPALLPAPKEKERPGFFRRVFGLGSSPAQFSREPAIARNDDMANLSRESQSAPSSSKGYRSSPRSVPNADQSSRENTPVVTKKPSSFFRRRKKSNAADHTPPPLMLAQSNIQPLEHSRTEHLKIEQVKNAEPSPVSSLRRVMKPFLADSASPIDEQNLRMEGAVYDSSDAGKPPFRGEGADSRAPAKSDRWSYRQNGTSQPKRGSLLRSKSGLNLNIPSHDRHDSFLADSSENESSSVRGATGRMRPMTSPNAPSHSLQNQFDNSQESLRALHSSGNVGGGLQHSSRLVTDRQSKSSVRSQQNSVDGASASASSSDNQQQKARRVSNANHDSNDQAAGHSTGLQKETGWLENIASAERLPDSDRSALPLEGANDSRSASMSTVSNYHTASNTPVIPDDDGKPRWSKPPELPPLQSETDLDLESTENHIDEIKAPLSADPDTPTATDREQAQKIYDESDEESESREPAAVFLGSPDRASVRKAFMELFDWTNMNILASLRSLCFRIALKAETQQVDRILDAFSCRWSECNPNHGFKATDVVHTICYSLLLLNTDLHLADIEQKMTRHQFIRNTMPTIQRVVADAAPGAFDSSSSTLGLVNPQSQNGDENAGSQAPKSPTLQPTRHKSHSSVDIANPNRLSRPVEPTPRANSVSTISTSEPSASEIGPLVTAPFRGTTMRAWEIQVEAVLKDFYNSIQRQRLPLRGAPADSEDQPQASNNFLTLTGNMLRRTPSTLSKAGSDTYPRGRPVDARLATARWSSKPRSRPRIYPNSTMGSSRTSLDDQSSIWSPSASSTWSKNSLGKTITSVSVDSFGSEYPRGDYQQSIGFANALSHAIIREDSVSVIAAAEDQSRTATLLEDESLELAGAPWAKEGSLKHKQHLNSVDKRAKDRNWNESFAVIQQGWMRLFSFNASTKSMRIKAKQRHNNGLAMGGGNWMENAEETWKFLLRQTIASALPPPGYSKSRPHVWALSLPTGAVHLFQVGTPEIVKEFVSTANYWSARLSKEPLHGGISNIEYGWSEAVINNALIHTEPQPPTSSAGGPRPSLQSSIRSSLDQQNLRPRLPADRIHISDWTPPQQTMLASTLSEAEQLTTLRNYVKHVENELQQHNELRSAMMLSFTPRHPNAAKAQVNWERKSSYLLREIVKFRTYIDCLQAAQLQKEKILSASKTDIPEVTVNAGSPEPQRERSASASVST
ncbi:hypothetical protein AJ80_07424 [Polytolypa hystricis UAMH7299]|uniref:SEC7 domain-containing protein n=1 Tax=Polytolypa hystricis (strain UAMH7299) TaxID=1447883 RepID=A0A2B7XPY9_POLH7|nr:hypothetical protein AJ80_07424 [Polytolypa hystricis UAMH7299]